MSKQYLYFQEAKLRWEEMEDNFHVLTTATDKEIQEDSYNFYLANIDDTLQAEHMYYTIFEDEKTYKSIKDEKVTSNLSDTKKIVEDYLIGKGIVTCKEEMDITPPAIKSTNSILERTKDYYWQLHEAWETFNENLQLDDWFYYTNLKDGNNSIFLVAYKQHDTNLSIRFNPTLEASDGHFSKYRLSVYSHTEKITICTETRLVFEYVISSSLEDNVNKAIQLFIDQLLSEHFNTSFVTNKLVLSLTSEDDFDDILPANTVISDTSLFPEVRMGNHEEMTQLVKESLESQQDIAASPVAVRFDTDKDLWSLLPWLALREVAYIFTLGAKKYSDRNWEKGFNYSRVFNSLMRHLTAWWNGEDNDPESSRSHLAHAACNVLFLLHFTLTNTGTDDRPQY